MQFEYFNYISYDTHMLSMGLIGHSNCVISIFILQSLVSFFAVRWEIIVFIRTEHIEGCVECGKRLCSSTAIRLMYYKYSQQVLMLV